VSAPERRLDTRRIDDLGVGPGEGFAHAPIEAAWNGLEAAIDQRHRPRHRGGSDGRQALGPLGKAQRQRRKQCFSDRRGIFREALVGATSISPRMRSRRTFAPRVFARCSELSVRNSAKSSDPFPQLNGGFGLFIDLILPPAGLYREPHGDWPHTASPCGLTVAEARPIG
jgi:hypothetical protein